MHETFQAPTTALTFVALALLVAPATGFAQQSLGVPSPDLDPAEGLEARVWLDRGDEAVVQAGDDVRVYYRTSMDAYAAIFRIDTDGDISLLFPQHPGVDNWVAGGRDYRLLLDRTPRWRVRDEPGMGYFFMIASPDPLDFSAFEWDDEYGWDLSTVGEVVYDDPYVAIDDYVAAILPDWEDVPYALDFLSYSVGEKQEYPRFLCYDCHQAQSYSSWNPYAYPCTTYQVVVWDDPYFAPRYRYAGTRVVYARPFGPRPRYGVSVRVGWSSRPVVVRSRPAPPVRTAVYKEPVRRPSRAVAGRTPPQVRPSPGRVAPSRGAQERAAPSRGSVGRTGVSRTAPAREAPTRATPSRTAPTRVTPSRAAPTRVTPSRSAPTGVTPSRMTPARTAPEPRSAPTRPTLQRRPAASGGSPRASAQTQAPPRARSAPSTSRTREPARGSRTSGASAPARDRAGSAPNRSTPRAAPTRSAPSGGSSRAAPARTPRGAPSRAAPNRSAPRSTPDRPRATPSRSTPAAAPSRPAARPTPARGGRAGERGSGRPRTGTGRRGG